uniref:ubiquitinyl hydrolase 1 n=2 Tax=Palpitomonas bilix TaxID=652834 RepID=A0A7S3DCQ0_9EUKA|mmetsp:Transcript_31878/g.83223  ORF Transcript_31878/g.83223 Transcript_31878/m.83223 type:complete len:501 (+) Transcript_31878:133-1635(+)
MADKYAAHRVRYGKCSRLPGSFVVDETLESPKCIASLVNLGNSCYFNASMQCLARAYGMPSFVRQFSQKPDGVCAMGRGKHTCAACIFVDQMNSMYCGHQRIIRPDKLYFNLGLLWKGFRIGRQEDAHEYITQILQKVQACTMPTPPIIKGKPGYPQKELNKCIAESPITKIFGGIVQSTVKCIRCNYISRTFESTTIISVDVPADFKLQTAWDLLQRPEVLSDGYKCDECKHTVKATKQVLLYRRPNTLVLQLKRFSFAANVFGGVSSKTSGHVKFPKALNADCVSVKNARGPSKYELYGVLVHSGYSVNSGHYYCYVKDGRKWFVVNDSQYKEVQESTVMDSEAYILFYGAVEYSFGGVICPPDDEIEKVRGAREPSCSTCNTRLEDRGRVCPVMGEQYEEGTARIGSLERKKRPATKDDVSMLKKKIKRLADGNMGVVESAVKEGMGRLIARKKGGNWLQQPDAEEVLIREVEDECLKNVYDGGNELARISGYAILR